MRPLLVFGIWALCTSQALGQAGTEMPAGLRCLRQAYPAHICSLKANAAVLCDGRELPFDDGQVKTHAEQLEHPDLEDSFAQPYAVNAPLPPAEDVEPGRVRYLPLFEAMYGATPEQVRQHLTHVAWLPSVAGRALEITTVNDVHVHLRAVSEALEKLPLEIRRQAAQVAGTFNVRNIAGTDRRSAHSYAIAIDVAPALADYWRWREPHVDRPQRYRNRIPLEIVHAFEQEGFIWGGRWHHYDTMHFEYRPELLVEACRGSVPTKEASAYPWLSHPAERLQTRFAPPSGYQRITLAPGSFGAWLRDLPLRNGRGIVQLFDGRNKALQNVHAAIVDIDVGQRDLQQCADAVMRLRAEYLFSRGQAAQVCFRAANGQALAYANYRREHAANAAVEHGAFRRYLDHVFGVANTASLHRELARVEDARGLQPGDVYIEPAHGGRFGHAVIVLDVARDAAGEPRFLIAQSYMPAQDIHVLQNPSDPAQSPWYSAPHDGSLHTPEWDFPPGSLRRFDRSCH